ncbi:hypothetical protein AAMO2058_001340700 [Amorphochlora amoebiformis]
MASIASTPIFAPWLLYTLLVGYGVSGTVARHKMPATRGRVAIRPFITSSRRISCAPRAQEPTDWDNLLMRSDEAPKRSALTRKIKDERESESKQLAEALCLLSEKKFKNINIPDSLRAEAELVRKLRVRPKKKSWARQLLYVRTLIRSMDGIYHSAPEESRELVDGLRKYDAIQ